jgi:predicted phosphodiesterase
MKKCLAVIFSVLPFILFAQTSIYDIQYSTDAAGGYPSPHVGSDVTTGGIVTVTNYKNGRYFISSSTGGAWNGIYIYDNTNSPSVGDSIIITGEVVEYYGLTEISNLTAYSTVSSSNSLPAETIITSAQVTDEAYEGVLVEITDCFVSGEYDNNGNWKVNDGSGECIIQPEFFNLENEDFPLIMGYTFSSVKGIVTDYYGASLFPRYVEDIQSGTDEFILSSEDEYIVGTSSFEHAIKVALLNQSASITNYVLNLTYDASIFTYNGYNKTGTLSQPGTITDNSTEGNISLSFTGSITCDDILTLIKLQFTPIAEGDGNLQFASPTINGSEIIYVSAGTFLSGLTECDDPKADTVTVVQRPLLNIPSIVAPGETLYIECFVLDETTTGWDAELIFNDITVDLTISQADYDSDLKLWTLQAIIPSIDHYELYDLRVTASGGISDNVANSVKLIDQYKDDYYFIQITDTHLIGHLFWGDPGYDTDETEIDDLHEVIKDINLLNPEFVLLTGDLINEGEMEDFECLRHHSKTVELLEEFEVPVYIVPGNHDLGGWDATPPPQGTARQEWWRFFGWRQRVVPIVEEEFYVHDYSFDYGDVHYVGLESSDNYDKYMYDVYGDKGFIPSQLTWLNSDLTSAGSKTKVLFYHFDFNGDIDLGTLGADMALWGHQHKNTDDFTHPFNIGTDNVCDGTGAYRVIRVSNGDLTPENTIYTNSSGQNLEISFSDENNGSVDSLAATITNNHNQAFTNTLVKFIMPESNIDYSITNGTLKQIINSNGKNICYVNVDLESNSEIIVSVARSIPASIISFETKESLKQNFPNPFQVDTQIDYELKRRADVKLQVYNSVGQQTKVLVNEVKTEGKHSVKWDGTNDAGAKVKDGVYFYKYSVNGNQVAAKQMVLIN